MSRFPAPAHRRLPTAKGAAGPIRRIVTAIGGLALAITLALIGTGTSYALWNGRAVVNGSSVSSGSTGLTVNGVTDYVIPAVSLAKLGPATPVLVPLTVKNTGTTPLAATIDRSAVLSQTNALADNVVLQLTLSPTCTAALPGGLSAPLASFTTTAAPYLLAAGASATLCLEVRLSAAAPAAVQGGTASFTLALTGLQVRP